MSGHYLIGRICCLHWFNEGVWGNGIQMIIVFSFTCIMGLLLAYAYVRTVSLLSSTGHTSGMEYHANYIFPGSETGPHIFGVGRHRQL